MNAMPGTMGMSLPTFTAMWSLMMAAMMLPSVGPFIGLYQRTVVEHRTPRLTALAGGYLAVWGASGMVAFAIADWFGELVVRDGAAAQAMAVATFAAVGVYQLSPLKYRCLSHCRTPLGHLVRYLGFRGPLRDLRAGVSHGWFCLGCCWALMVLMVAFGVMNIAAMVGLAIIIGVEKLWRHGETFARAVGGASLVYAVQIVSSLKDPRSKELLVKLLRHRNMAARRVAIANLSEYARDEDIRTLLFKIASKKNGDPLSRQQAAFAFKHWELTKKNLKTLEGVWKKGNPQMRRAVALALAYREPESAVVTQLNRLMVEPFSSMKFRI